MVSPRTRTTESVPCDFCTHQTALLYCRADSAKLCLLCDQHVHSANLLSRKHSRSQICDNCSSEPGSVRCNTDNLVLCQDCDWDAHAACSVSASHNRSPIEGFTGCPSALELASIWGFDLEAKYSRQSQTWPVVSEHILSSLQSWVHESDEDLVVPNSNALDVSRPSNFEGSSATAKKQSRTCGKHRQSVYKQLAELLKRECEVGFGADNDNDHTDELAARENLNDCRPSEQGNASQTFGSGLENDVDDGFLEGPAFAPVEPYTSLVMISSQQDLEHKKDSDATHSHNMMWDSIPSGQATQIWDFHSGRKRHLEDASTMEFEYDQSGVGFTVKDFGEYLRTEFATDAKTLEDFCETNCPIGHEDIAFYNNISTNSTASQGPATSESNNLPGRRESPASALTLNKGCLAKEMQLVQHPLIVNSNRKCEETRSKTDVEILAENRGHAMLRYKEKKKNRRYDKLIRYESRKARADTRKRVKGRFVKASESPID